MARNGLVEPFVGVGFWDFLIGVHWVTLVFWDWVEGNFDWVELV